MVEAEVRFKIPGELKEEMVVEFIRLKIFEHELKKSKELQRFILESLSAKGKLTLENAIELGNKIKEGMLYKTSEISCT